MTRGYDVVHSEEDERSPPKLELAEQNREYINSKSTQSPTIRRTLPSPPSSSHPPLITRDFSSVRIRPVPVRAQAVMTSTYGHTRLNWPAVAKVNRDTEARASPEASYNSFLGIRFSVLKI